MDGYGVEAKEIEAMITKGKKWKEEKTDKWHASMAGMEVVFQREEDKIIIITVYEV